MLRTSFTSSQKKSHGLNLSLLMSSASKGGSEESLKLVLLTYGDSWSWRGLNLGFGEAERGSSHNGGANDEVMSISLPQLRGDRWMEDEAASGHTGSRSIRLHRWITDGDGAVSDATSCEILRLPAEVLSSVIGRSTPKDACCCAAVSTWFRLSADSDTAWSLLLPPDINSILSRADAPPAPELSKKQLFQSLCDRPILLNAATVSFCLEHASGKKVWMLPAREITGILVSAIQCRWHPHPDSRFPEGAELMDACWLEIGGTIISGKLSPNSTYAAYFVYKLSRDWYGLDCKLSTSVSVGGVHVSGHENVRLASGSMPMVFKGRQLNSGVVDDEIDVGDGNEDSDDEEARHPHVRADGWMEVEMGEFHIDNCDDECEISLELIGIGPDAHWKRGLVVEGIEIRPQKLN